MRHSVRLAGALAIAFSPVIGCGDIENGPGGGVGGGGGSLGDAFPCTERGIRDAIAQGGGPHTFDCGGPATIVTSALIEIDNDVVLDGEGRLTIDAGHSHRVFYVDEEVVAELHGLSITGGNVFGDPKGVASGSGAGIQNRGELLLEDSKVFANEVGAFANGGGIGNFGTMTLTRTTVSENLSLRVGGGIYNGGVMVIRDSTVSGNRAENRGGPTVGNVGGIANDGGELTLINSTVSGNAAVDVMDEGGGGIGGIANLSRGTLTLLNSTISGNTASREIGALYSFRGELTITNTILAGDCEIDLATVPPIEVRSNGHNIESPGDTCGLSHDSDRVSVRSDELKLGDLAENGGPTDTHALLPGSIAIDMIPAAACKADRDQRGEPRPGGTMCDAGAFEAQP